LITGLAIVLMKSGCPEETVDRLREAVRRHPGHLTLASQLAFTLNYPHGIEPKESLAAHRAYGELVACGVQAETHVRPTAAEAERRLRVGFVSSDLRTHACSFFFESVIASLNRREFDTCCYSVTVTEDRRTSELKRCSSMWRHCPAVTPEALAKRIRSDRMDILVDLSGLTDGGRMDVFAMRPAPVQMTYLGYPNTTGVPTIDHRIVDSITDPPGAEQFATERLLRVDPCFLCYTGMPEARADEVPPSQRGGDGPVTFGSFNALQKVNDPVMRLWARVIDAVPASRLAVKYMSMGDEATRFRLKSRLLAAGVPEDRMVLMHPRAEYKEHLESYAEVDIGLDTFPYNGTTTTCEAMWMGVPVITLASLPFTHAARVGASLLHAVGLDELVASDEDALVRVAADLAGDRARLRALRAGMRARMVASPLCDRAAFGVRFGDALRRAWREWCQA
jgi:predicted O-linked N-acetylglucosamine transferase (SPINDLY family)